MARILVDSDVLVDHLRGHRRFVAGRDEVHVSTISRAELVAGRSTDEARIRLLLTAMTEIPVDAAIAERAGRIRRASRARLPGALIAATAIEHGLTLVTRNVRDFEAIRGLRVRAPTGGASPSG
jgi:predicted nucleic acid-binding protein